MLNLESKTRDEIVRFLQAQVVPANVGAGLMECARILANLKEVKEEPPKVEEKTDDTNQEPKVSA
jgi:hypothetical protein